jgi:hypothetical protein
VSFGIIRHQKIIAYMPYVRKGNLNSSTLPSLPYVKSVTKDPSLQRGRNESEKRKLKDYEIEVQLEGRLYTLLLSITLLAFLWMRT